MGSVCRIPEPDHVSFSKNRVSFGARIIFFEDFHAGGNHDPDHVNMGLFGKMKNRRIVFQAMEPVRGCPDEDMTVLRAGRFLRRENK